MYVPAPIEVLTHAFSDMPLALKDIHTGFDSIFQAGRKGDSICWLGGCAS